MTMVSYKVTIVLTIYTLLAQQPRDIQFFYNRMTYSFSLPDLPYQERTSSYTEGTLRSFSFPSGQRIGLFVGRNMLLPLLKGKNYKVLSEESIDGMMVRKGCDKKTGKFWQEVTMANKTGVLISIMLVKVRSQFLKSPYRR